MSSPVVWFEVLGNDTNLLRGFYAKLFGWKFSQMPGEMDYQMVNRSPGGIDGAVGKACAEFPEGHAIFYVGVEDVKASLEQAVSLGGRVILDVLELPMVTIALLADPEGHVVGLVKEKA